MTITTDYRTISTFEAKAIREANSLCFDHMRGHGQIRAILRDADHNETQVRIPAHHSHVESFRAGDTDTASGFSYMMNVAYVPEMVTIRRRLITGAAFTLHWTAYNQSPLLDEAGLVCDELRIRIQGPRATVADTFLVSRQVSRNDSARMIRGL